MLTGEYGALNSGAHWLTSLTSSADWSNTPAMSQATADKIPGDQPPLVHYCRYNHSNIGVSGAKHQAMEGLGHFPATENPAKFVPYLLTAIEHIQNTRQ